MTNKFLARYGISDELIDILTENGITATDETDPYYDLGVATIRMQVAFGQQNSYEFTVEIPKNAEKPDLELAKETDCGCRHAISLVYKDDGKSAAESAQTVSALMDVRRAMSRFFNDYNSSVFTCECGCRDFIATETVKNEVSVNISAGGKAMKQNETGLIERKIRGPFTCAKCGKTYKSIEEMHPHTIVRTR